MPLPNEVLDSFIQLPFEDGEFMCFENWAAYLSIKYGDYMKLPPEDDRIWRHHPIILDFEHDLKELNNI